MGGDNAEHPVAVATKQQYVKWRRMLLPVVSSWKSDVGIVNPNKFARSSNGGFSCT
eukprot:COSAG02_NODE_19351_length_886_cov_1.110546_1_plen_55_part_10